MWEVVVVVVVVVAGVVVAGVVGAGVVGVAVGVAVAVAGAVAVARLQKPTPSRWAMARAMAFKRLGFFRGVFPATLSDLSR